MDQFTRGIVRKFFPAQDRQYGFLQVEGQPENLYFNMKGGHRVRYLKERDTIQIFYQRPCLPSEGEEIMFQMERNGARMKAITWYFRKDFDEALMLRELLLPVTKKSDKVKLTLNLARALLSHCTRDVLEDKTFGGTEITWNFEEHSIAVGCFGITHESDGVSIAETATYASTSFKGCELRHTGKRGGYTRNDEGGCDIDVDERDLETWSDLESDYY